MLFSEIYQDVQNKFRNSDTTFLTYIKNWINEGQRVILSLAPWSFNLTYMDIQMKDGQEMYDLYNWMPTDIWYVGQWTHATSTNVDDTTDAQDIVGTNDCPLTTTTDGDGFTVGAQVKFDRVEIKVSTASDGGTPEYVYEYCNGKTWTDLKELIIETPYFDGTGFTYFSFKKPAVWAKYSGTETGLTAGRYYVRIRTVTAPTTTAPIADYMKVGNKPILKIYDILRNNVKLAEVDLRNFDYLIADPTTRNEGNPSYFCQFGRDRIKVYPIPDTDATAGDTHPSDQILRVQYYQKAQELINDEDIPIIPEEYHHALVLYAWATALESDTDKIAPAIWARFLKTMDDMRRNYITGQSVDKVRVIKSIEWLESKPPYVRLPDEFPRLF